MHDWEECGSNQQSPIDITIEEDFQCQEPLILDWTAQLEHYAIRNNGHSLQAIPFEIDTEGGGDMSSLRYYIIPMIPISN